MHQAHWTPSGSRVFWHSSLNCGRKSSSVRTIWNFLFIRSSHKLELSLLKELSAPYSRYTLFPGIQRWVSSAGVYKNDFSYEKKHLIIFKNRKYQKLIEIYKQLKSAYYKNAKYSTFDYNQKHLLGDIHIFEQSIKIANKRHFDFYLSNNYSFSKLMDDGILNSLIKQPHLVSRNEKCYEY